VIWHLGVLNPWINVAQVNEKSAINKGVSTISNPVNVSGFGQFIQHNAAVTLMCSCR
jgi:hypothetical protein